MSASSGQPRPRVSISVIKAVVLTGCCACVIIPFLGIFATSVAPADQLQRAGGFVLLPDAVNLDAYRSILSGGVVTQGLLVSLFVTICGTALALLASTLFAYGLSRPELPGRRWMLMLVLVSLLFSPGIIPTYLVVKGLGMLDSLAALIVPTMISGFNVVILRAFFMNLPRELMESSTVDGASHWQTFRLIVLPLSKAILAVVGLFYAVGYWNSFFSALLYINDQSKWPIQLILRTYVVNDTQLTGQDLGLDRLPPQPAIQMAILVISLIPILVVYPFLQRHFTKGVLTGAVKG